MHENGHMFASRNTAVYPTRQSRLREQQRRAESETEAEAPSRGSL